MLLSKICQQLEWFCPHRNWRPFTFCPAVDIMVKTTIFDREVNDCMMEKEIFDLLYRIDDGYCPTKEERQALKRIDSLWIHDEILLHDTLPGSMHYLKSLEQITLYRISCLSSFEPLLKISKLKHLYILHMQSIPDLSPLVHSVSLEGLHIFSAPVTDISVLADLPNLKSLTLQNTGVTSIAPIRNHPKLKELYLYNNPIMDYSHLAAMSNLRKFGYAGMQACPHEMGQWISEITELILYDSGVSDLNVFYPCTKLNRLWLDCTNIHVLPTWLGDRMPLEWIVLQHLELHDLPASLMKLNLPYNVMDVHPEENGIYLQDTTLAVQPISLFEQERDFIQAYYDAEKIPINESKVIFLGDGGVGKTHTIMRILNGGKRGEYKTETTPGIDITQHSAEYDGRKFQIHFWDFGGQEIMHAMHRCFLTERTCYVVVLSNRADSDLTARARYWLRNIQSFAPKAKVLLALNRWDDIAAGGIDMSRLLAEYKNLCPEPVHFSAKNSSDEDFGMLTRAIIREAAALDSSAMEFPVQWANVRQKLLDSARIKHYIDKDDYHRFCAEEGLDAPNIRTWLLEWFNDLGVCFSYHQEKDGSDQPTELEEYKVLNPRWLTNAIYILINHGRNYAENGKLHRNNIRDLLQNPILGVLKDVSYTENEQKYVLDVMRKFKLSYNVSDTHEFIPALCDPNTPKKLHPTGFPKHVSYQMQYTFLPDSVIHQLMIRCYNSLNFAMLWRKGMRLDIEFAGLCAVVDMGSDDSTLRIDVYGTENSQPWMLLQNLRTHLLEINHSLGLTAEDSIIVRDNDYEEPISIDELLCAKEEKLESIRFFNSKKKSSFYRDVNDLLNLTFGEKSMIKAQKLAKEKQTPITNVFVDCTIGQLSYNQETSDPDYMKLIQLLFEKQAQLDSEVISALTEALKKSDSDELKEIATEAEKKSDKGILARLKNLIETTGSVAENGEKIYKAGNAIIKALTPYIPLIVKKIPEIAEYLQHIPVGIG